MSKNDDEDYWNSSDKKSFNFSEEDEGEGLFGVSRQGTARLSQQLRDWELGGADDAAGTPVADPVRPLHQLISESSLSLILETHSLQPTLKTCLAPEELVQKLVLGLPANLEGCRSLSTKSELLSSAVKSGDGEAILTVTLFVLGSLSKQLSYQLLREHSAALSHYLNYLAARGEKAEMCNLLEALGQSKSAAIINYNLACHKKGDVKKQIQDLSKVADCHFQSDRDERVVRQHVKLLEFQRDHGLEGGASAQQLISRAAAQLSVEALRTLATSLGMSERVFQWTCLRAKVAQQAWGEVNALFHTKSWLGQKFKPLIPMAKVALELQKAKAPKSEVERYIQLVDDVVERRRLLAGLEGP